MDKQEIIYFTRAIVGHIHRSASKYMSLQVLFNWNPLDFVVKL